MFHVSGTLKSCHSTAAFAILLLQAIRPCTVGKWFSLGNLVKALFIKSTTSTSPKLLAAVSQRHLTPYINSEFNSRHIAAQPISAANPDATTSQSSKLHPLRSVVPEITGHPKTIWVSFGGAHQVLAVVSQGTVDVDGFKGAIATKILRRTGSLDVFLILSSARKPIINSDVELKGVANGNDEQKNSDGEKR